MKFSGRAVYLLGVALFVGEEGGVVDAGPPCSTTGIDSSRQQTFDYGGFTVKATPDGGIGDIAFPSAGDLLEIRESQNGCADSIEFKVLQNMKVVTGGIITTGDTISHINVQWDSCTGASCTKTTDDCNKFDENLPAGTDYPTGDGWYSACCVDGWATIQVQFNDGQFAEGDFAVCNDNFSCGGNGPDNKNALYQFEVSCDGGPDPTFKPTASPTAKPTAGPTDAAIVEVCPEMGSNGDSACPNAASSIVKILNDDGTVSGADTQHMIWDISFVSDNEITFRVDNPYEEVSHIFVEYNSPVGSNGAFDFNCDANLNVPGCDTDNADLLTAHCYRGLEKHTRVALYFVSADDALVETTPSPELPCCADSAPAIPGGKVRKVVLQIDCACPTDA